MSTSSTYENRLKEFFIPMMHDKLKVNLFQQVFTNFEHAKIHELVTELVDLSQNEKRLIQIYTESISKYCISNYQRRLQVLESEQFLTEMTSNWQHYKAFVFWIRKAFMQLEKEYKFFSLLETALVLFKIEIVYKYGLKISQGLGELSNFGLKQQVNECLASLEVKDPKITRNYQVGFLIEGKTILGSPKDIFGVCLPNRIQNSYYFKCPELLDNSQIDAFIQKAQEEINEVRKKSLHKLFVRKAISGIVNNLCTPQLIAHNKSGLKSYFRKFSSDISSNSNKLKYLILEPYIKELGAEVIAQEEVSKSPRVLYEKMVDFRTQMHQVFREMFTEEKVSRELLSATLNYALNECGNSASNLALFCDKVMRGELGAEEEAQISNCLENIISLFKELNDKDIFIDEYSFHLHRRFIDEKTIGTDFENSMIAQIKTVYTEDLSALNFVMRDTAISQELNEEFNLKHDSKLKVQIRRGESLPRNQPCEIPLELESLASKFQSYFSNKHQTSQLKWIQNDNLVEVKMLNTNYTFVLNFYQAAALLLFNQTKTFTLKEIAERLKVEPRFLKANLIMLFNPKKRLLLKSSSGKTIENNENISVNERFFQSRNYVDFRPKTNSAVKNQENQFVRKRRELVLQASIVKIAKERKSLTHTELLGEVIRRNQSFKALPKMVKSQVEELIHRGILKRNTENFQKYDYIA